MADYDGYPVDVVEERGEWPNPPIIERVQLQPLLPCDEPECTLCRMREEWDEKGLVFPKNEQGWVFKHYRPCGVREHRHSWRFTAWLCRLVNDVP